MIRIDHRWDFICIDKPTVSEKQILKDPRISTSPCVSLMSRPHHCLLEGGVQLVFALRESRGTLGWALILVWPTEVIVQKDLQLSLWSPAWWRNTGCLRLDEQIHYMHAQTMGECGRMAWRDDRPTRHNKMFSLRICR
jgi:hypothetical protein